MNHLTLPILEFILSQPAHKLPAAFTSDKNPLPASSDSSEEIFQEALKLHREGWVEAHIIRGVTGQTREIQISYITLEGRLHLDSKYSKMQENAPLIRALLIGAVLLTLLALAYFIFRGHPVGISWLHGHK